MCGIALDARGPAIVNSDEDATGVGTIMRTGSVDDALHCSDYTGESRTKPESKQKRAAFAARTEEPTRAYCGIHT